ncbi:E3 ubiquitin-protein ligase UBR2, partial [Geodia barretti]
PSLGSLSLSLSSLSLPHDCPPEAATLETGAREYLHSFLQCSVLFFQSLTGIHFTPPSDDGQVFSDMCMFLNIPHSLHTLLDKPDSSSSPGYSLRRLAGSWSSHSRLRELGAGAVASLPPILRQPRQLISLPRSYSDLVNKASKFKCANHVVDGDDGQAAMLCLLCGQMLCTNSYCCMTDVEDEEEEEDNQPGHKRLRIGGLTRHAQTCGDGVGMALWILEVYVVLLDATNIRHVKGCTLTPPYLDQYGESDPGLRRGSPLLLSEESVQQLDTVWFQHQVPERITQEMEQNRNLMGIVWSQM